MLEPEIDWIEGFRHQQAGGEEPIAGRRGEPRLLASMARMLGARQAGRVSLSTSSLQTLLDGIGSRLSETRETSRYLIGVLIFLGLLGTFYGLLETVRSVGGVIGGSERRRRRSRPRLRQPQSRARIAARRDGDRVQLVAVRARRQPRAGLSRSAGGTGAEPLLQRPRRVAVGLYPVVGRRLGRGRRRADPGLYPGLARTDRGQPRKSAAHPRPRRGESHRRQLDLGEFDRPPRHPRRTDEGRPDADAAARREPAGAEAGAGSARRRLPTARSGTTTRCATICAISRPTPRG